MIGEQLFFGGFANDFSVNFDGVNDYVTAGSVSDFNYYHGATNPSAFAFSISVWVKFNNPNANAAQTIFNNNGFLLTQVGLNIQLESRTSFARTRAIRLLINRGSSPAVITALSASNIYPNTTGWVNIVWTHDQSLATLNSKIYINNSLAFQANKGASAPSTANASFAMHFGTLPSGGDRINGRIYHPIFINKVLSLAERNELYNTPHKNARLYSFGSNVTNAYRFPQGQSGFPTWVDYIAGINGTMTNQTSADIVLDRP